jgi:hypothetical protein
VTVYLFGSLCSEKSATISCQLMAAKANGGISGTNSSTQKS